MNNKKAVIQLQKDGARPKAETALAELVTCHPNAVGVNGYSRWMVS